MRGAGAAKRREQEQSEPPDGAEAVAGLLKATAAIDAVLGRMNRRDGDIARIVAALEELGAACGNAEQFAALAGEMATQQSLQVVESISCAAHAAEAREAAELAASVLGLRASVYQAGIAEGERREAKRAAERDARPRAAQGRGAHRKRHLSVAGGITASSAVAASLVAGGAVVASQDSASVHHWPPHPVAARLHLSRPDTAVLMPQSRPSPSPRLSAAAASASPAVTVTPSAPVSSPPPAPSPPPPPPAPVPVLSVPRFLDLGDSIRGQLTLTAGPDAVTWTARAADGITLSSYGGVMLAGQQVELQVTDAPAGGGWIYISAGTQTFTVHVTSGLGPVLS